jgi:hypothetical protein
MTGARHLDQAHGPSADTTAQNERVLERRVAVAASIWLGEKSEKNLHALEHMVETWRSFVRQRECP